VTLIAGKRDREIDAAAAGHARSRHRRLGGLVPPPVRSTGAPDVGTYSSVVPLIALPAPDILIVATALLCENVPSGVPIDVPAAGSGMTDRVNGPAARLGFPNESMITGTPTTPVASPSYPTAPPRPSAAPTRFFATRR